MGQVTLWGLEACSCPDATQGILKHIREVKAEGGPVPAGSQTALLHFLRAIAIDEMMLK